MVLPYKISRLPLIFDVGLYQTYQKLKIMNPLLIQSTLKLAILMAAGNLMAQENQSVQNRPAQFTFF